MRANPRSLGVVLALAALGCGGARQKPADTSADALMGPAPSAQAKPKSSPLVREAESLLAKGDAQGAYAKFQQALEQDARDVRALLGLGLSAEALAKPAEAERAYRSAIELSPGFAEAHNNLGLMLRDQGDDAAAIEQFRLAVEADSTLSSAQANLALALEDAGRAEDADEAYARAVQLSPKDALLRANRAQFLLGRGQQERALTDLRAGLAAAGGDRAALLALGNGFRRAGKPDEAVRAMRSALAAGNGKPTPALLSELALAQLGAKDEAGAKASLEQAVQLDPRYATAYYLLGSIEADRDARVARAHYEKYLALEPNGPLAGKARGKLAQLKR